MDYTPTLKMRASRTLPHTSCESPLKLHSLYTTMQLPPLGRFWRNVLLFSCESVSFGSNFSHSSYMAGNRSKNWTLLFIISSEYRWSASLSLYTRY